MQSKNRNEIKPKEDKQLILRNLNHGTCVGNTMTPKIISIQRYYEFGTGIKYLNSNWADFFGAGGCSEIITMVYQAASFKTGSWVTVTSPGYGVGSINCYAEINTGV